MDFASPASESTAGTFSIASAARLVRGLYDLPAVPTTDWADLAAYSLGCPPWAGMVAVIIERRLPEHDEAWELEACGSWDDRSEGVSLPTPRLTRGFTSAEEFLSKPGSSGPVCERVPEGWARAMWDDQHVCDAAGYRDMIAGDTRRLTVLMATRETGLPEPLIGFARCAGGLLVERARLAFGHAPRESSPWLTEREREILDRLVLGQSVRQIGDALARSPHTIHDHVKNLHRKLGASTRGELVAKALGRRQIGSGRSEIEAKPAEPAQGTERRDMVTGGRRGV